MERVQGETGGEQKERKRAGNGVGMGTREVLKQGRAFPLPAPLHDPRWPVCTTTGVAGVRRERVIKGTREQGAGKVD